MSWVMQLFHGLKLGFFILVYLLQRYHLEYTDFFEYLVFSKMKLGKTDILRNIISDFFITADGIPDGKARGVVMQDFGNIYWEQEEAAFFKISHNKADFYLEMYELVKGYLGSKSIVYNDDELREVARYQEARIPDYKPIKHKEHNFIYNLSEYFDTYFLNDSPGISLKPQVMVLDGVKDYSGDKEAFAREVIVYGRKSNRILNTVKWYNRDMKAGDTKIMAGKAKNNSGG